MIELRDTVEIQVPTGAVWAWLETMPDHILEWHPDHIDARWVSGGGFVPGAVMEVREVLHGKPHRLRMRLTDVVPGRRVSYRIFPGLRGRMEAVPVNGATEFTASIMMGVDLPVLGHLVDALVHRLLGRRIEALRKHQAEEGANLKAILENRPFPTANLAESLHDPK